MVGSTQQQRKLIPGRWIMLTLGLMEGVLSAMVGVLFLIGAANANAPLHRLFGPLVVVVLAPVAYGVHASGAFSSGSNVVGLGFFAFIAFFVPLAIMRAGWKMTKAMDAATSTPDARRSAPALAPVVVAVERTEIRKVA
jgi:hypothetical protein